ncbi:hypothetical protein [Hymenobacter negativus]|uniref:Uncharacterized protein n=1 Tax=Hymenobacter negativus TaxID=2795026 RepID=A0ABS3QNU4_9BACT|nr:hypothetical protein [Hymenobacter negativus]MBO2012678.1 hypothetical protein [Hymenobacter negativus]
MRIKPFHSPLRGIGLATVWHDHARCPIAQSIAPADQLPGKGLNLPRCPYCAMLDRWPTPPPPVEEGP